VIVATGLSNIAINSAKYLFFNAVGDDGLIASHASTINSLSIQDTNIIANRYMTLRADGPGYAITSIASTITLNANLVVNLTSVSDTINITAPTQVNIKCGDTTNILSTYTGQFYTSTSIELLQANASGFIRRNAQGNIIDSAVGNIQTSAVSTVNTVAQTIFTGGVSRTLIGSNIQQPIIQTGFVSSSGASGTITINLPQRYTTQQSYTTFGNMIDSPAAQIFTSSISRGSFILGWSSAGGGTQTFNWMTLGL
jgi:hypothetical protein